MFDFLLGSILSSLWKGGSGILDYGFYAEGRWSPLKLNNQEKDIVRRKFCAYCNKVLRGEALNYFDELKRKQKREINFSDFFQKDLETLGYYDNYEIAENFIVLGNQVSIYDEGISQALKKLPSKKRDIILMLFFLDMTEKEIAACLQLVQSTVHYHKSDSLKLLRKILGWIYIWSLKKRKKCRNLKLLKQR